ncbi:hypothetical protein [Streptomyces salinarius]|uniref:hypothetical protein n=1 Tax=Streptomyces salinarius TaxID=2762598 RepID=UPI003F484606
MPARAGRYASALSQPACLLARPAACAPTHGPPVPGTAPEDTVPAAARVGGALLVTCAPAHPRTGQAGPAPPLFATDRLAHAAGPGRPAACAPTHGPPVPGTAPEDTVPAAARVGGALLVTCAPAHPRTGQAGPAPPRRRCSRRTGSPTRQARAGPGPSTLRRPAAVRGRTSPGVRVMTTRG